ncbi:MAG: pseudouridine-5'-phosphate glycosidase [Rhizobiales bacterium]|nr:pseudouridine-5'-phosphate glycosidase [Hyphomicrobiales bacterium]
MLHIAPEVRDALAASRPVVALESAIITHGMPFPENLRMARDVEAIVRAEGAIPATIALMDGGIRVGLDDGGLEKLASVKGAAKASRRDLAALLVKRADAGTTVAATMIAAHAAGILVFATGGIGGVHRGASKTFDISADLEELGRTPVAVVCAGAKSILDIPKTLEVLETHGVPVLGHQTDEFPAFFARSSGEKVDHRFDTPRELAEVIDAQRRLGLGTGMLIANPIAEEHALAEAEMEARIAAACREAERAGVSGKALTPFLLTRINELTSGASLKANIALVKANAALAASIAVELAALSAGR